MVLYRHYFEYLVQFNISLETGFSFGYRFTIDRTNFFELNKCFFSKTSNLGEGKVQCHVSYQINSGNSSPKLGKTKYQSFQVVSCFTEYVQLRKFTPPWFNLFHSFCVRFPEKINFHSKLDPAPSKFQFFDIF